MKAACNETILVSPLFLDLVIQANKEHLMAVNVSQEIAKFIHTQLLQDNVDALDFDEFLIYNLDMSRLEERLRNY